MREFYTIHIRRERKKEQFSENVIVNSLEKLEHGRGETRERGVVKFIIERKRHWDSWKGYSEN